MIRKPPLRTYQRKKAAQSSVVNYQQSSLWESRSNAKRISTKNDTPVLQSDENVGDFSDCYETTFDRLAKTARLPPPVHRESQSLIDTSSDLPIGEEPSPVETKAYKLPLRNESQRGRAGGRAKRRANRSRAAQEDTEVVLKKRLKQDLVNLSIKKAKPVRTSKRKVTAKSGKTLGDRRKKQDLEVRGSTANDSKDWFVVRKAKASSNGGNEKEQKKKERYPLRGKKKVVRISSCSDSDDSNEPKKNFIGKQKTSDFSTIFTSYSKLSSFLETEIEDKGEEKKNRHVGNLGKTENKENALISSNYSVNNSRISTISNRTRSKLAMRNSPALEYSVNFRSYSALKDKAKDSYDEPDVESSMEPNTYNKILTRKQYVSQTRSKLTRKLDSDTSDSSKNVSTRRRKSEQLKHTKPCSIVLLKCNENQDQVMSRKESTQPHNDVNSSGDIFQSSITNAASNIDQETENAVKPGLLESERTGEAPSNRNKSDLVGHFDMGNKPSAIVSRRQCSMKQKLNYLTCSTPINAFVNINDRSINCLSPIDGREDVEPSEMNYNGDEEREELADEQKPKVRRRSARKRLSISYEEDKSFEPSNENCRRSETGGKSVADCENSGHMQSPISEIQESLEILKLNLGNPTNKHDADKRRLSQKERVAISADSNRSSAMFEKTNRYCSTNEYTEKSKDTCSQLTPVGIITTRSGRQLKLSMTAHEKFLNDSNDAKDLPGTPKLGDDKGRDCDYEIIDNSETEKHENPMNRINKIRGSRFTVFKSASKGNTFNDIKSICIPHEIDCDEIQANPNASEKWKTISPDIQSRCSTSDNGRESSSNSSSDLDNEGSNPQIEYATSSNQEVLQSIIESTKNLDSLQIRSPNYNEPECSSDSEDNDSGSDWSTFCSNEDNDEASNVQEKTTDKSNSGSLSCTGNDEDDSKAACSIPSSGENDYSTRSDVQEEINQESDKGKKLIDPPLASEKQGLESDLSVETRDEISRTAIDLSSDIAEMALSERLELLSTRVNTRKRRKPLTKRVTEHVLQVSEDEAAIRSSDRSKLTDSFDEDSINGTFSEETHSHNEPRDSDLFKRPLDLAQIMNLKPVVVIEKLKDSVIITTSKTKAVDLALTAIHETSNETFSHDDSKEESNEEHLEPSDSPIEISEKMDNSSFKATGTPGSAYDCGASKFDLTEPEVVGRQSVFLKPGKDYARSLSVLNNIQDGSDLELLSTGKGKNWRKSVQTILGMQRERSVQSCLGKNEDDKDVQPRFRALHCTSIPESTPCSEKSASPSRFIRRMSIRVVPDNKKLSHIEDTSFLEAYGITASKSRKTLSRRSESKSGRRSLVFDVHCEDAAIETVNNGRISTARDVVLQRCCQEDYLPFTQCFPPEYLENCRKIGEGVYGEVFLHEQGKEKSVIKIIPIEGTALVNGERQKRFDEILSEIVIAMELHNLRYGDKHQTQGFVEVRNIKCIIGEYPEELVELWKAYDDDKGSDNDCPSMFDRNQLYIVLELGHGGQDLEAFVFPSAVQAHALFVQTALALAVAEQSLEFEHRDLHWGNILISNTEESRIGFKLNNKEYSYPTKGMQVAIIDFTLSRMFYEGCCIFNDLALDPALFTAEGEYQFEIYRLMREKIGNNWQKFEPYTNILWLHYTLDKMITALRYKKKSTKVHKEAISQLQDLKDVVLDYDSAFDFVTNCDEITSLQCKSTTGSTTVKSTQIESDELNEEKY